jgi:hypothetical protein
LTLEGETYRLALNNEGRAKRLGGINGFSGRRATIDKFQLNIAQCSVMKFGTLMRRPG